MDQSTQPHDRRPCANGQTPEYSEEIEPQPLRVLVVEDEMVIAMLIEDMVAELGYEVGGVASRLGDAIALVERDSFDLAILDVHLNGQQVFALADILIERGIAFMFATAYGERGIPEKYLHRPVLQKPFSSLDLKRALQNLVRKN